MVRTRLCSADVNGNVLFRPFELRIAFPSSMDTLEGLRQHVEDRPRLTSGLQLKLLLLVAGAARPGNPRRRSSIQASACW